MSVGKRLGLRTLLFYLGNTVVAAMFLLFMSNLLWLQTILALGVLAGFCMLCYNEGGTAGERGVTRARTLDKRLAEGYKVDPASDRERYNRKHALTCFLCASLPLFILATANLIASPRYPVITPETAQTQEEADPFHYDADSLPSAQNAEDETALAEPGWQVALRIVTRFVFAPLLPLYSILAGRERILYAIFLPFSFLHAACTALGYLRGPQIREKKLTDIARGKVRKKRGLLVGQNRGPRQPKPEV